MKVSRRAILRAGCLTLIGGPATVTTYPALAQVTSELDLRSKPRSADAYFVVLSARAQQLKPEFLTRQQFSLGGHGYVALGREDPNRLMSYARTFGAHPVEDSLGKWSLIIGSIPGEVRKVLERDISVRLIMRVDDTDYNAAEQIINAWAARGTYQLLWQDCTTMMNEVAAKLSLKVPARDATSPDTWFPAGAMTKLVAENPQSAFLNGTWESSEAGSRFRLEIRNGQCSWKERTAAGTTFTSSATVEKAGNEFKISRKNDAAVLAFLGARPNAVAEILARSPPPSYMILNRPDASSLTGRWSGLRWTLDNQGRLVNLFPPGTTTTAFNFAPAKP